MCPIISPSSTIARTSHFACDASSLACRSRKARKRRSCSSGHDCGIAKLPTAPASSRRPSRSAAISPGERQTSSSRCDRRVSVKRAARAGRCARSPARSRTPRSGGGSARCARRCACESPRSRSPSPTRSATPQRPRHTVPAPGAPDGGQVVVRARRPRLRQRELRVADDLVACDGYERRLREIARPLHVVGEPVLERFRLLVLVAGDVGRRLGGDLVDPARELRPIGPAGDLDALRRRDRRRLDPGELEHDALLATHLDEASPPREGEARRVVVGDDHLDFVQAALARPGRQRLVQRRARTASTVRRRHRHEHLDTLREAGMDRGETRAEDAAVAARQEIGVGEQLRLERVHLGQREAGVWPRLVVRVERKLLLARVGYPGDFDHANNDRDYRRNLVAGRAASYAQRAALVLSLEKYPARIGLTAVAALALAGTAAVLLVLLDGRAARIAVASASWLVGLAFTVWVVRRARARERARRDELAGAEARHSALLDGLPLVTWLRAVGDPTETLYVAPTIAELTGYSASEWREQPELYGKLLHPDDRERVLPELEQIAEGAPVTIDYRLLARDGRAAWIREVSSTVRDPQGEPLYVQTFLRDVGELRRADERRELLQAAEREAASESSERQSRLDLLRRAGNEISASVELDGALTRVAELIVADFADWCVVDVVDEANELRRAAAARAELAAPNGARGPQDDPETEVHTVFESGRAQVLPELGDASAGKRVSFVGLDTRSVMCVPIWARKQPLGALTLARTERGPVYSADDVALAEDLAARVAL